MSIAFFTNIVVFCFLLWSLYAVFRGKSSSLAVRVFSGLIAGALFGVILHVIYGLHNPVLEHSVIWFDIVGSGYVLLLKMVIMPLVFVSILSAVARLQGTAALGKISVITIGILVVTTAISAFVGVMAVVLFGLDTSALMQGVIETERLQILQNNYVGQVVNLSVPQLLLSFIPANPFANFAGTTSTSIIAVVIFAAFLGVAALALWRDDQQKGEQLLAGIDVLRLWIMKLVRLVIGLTPYGVFALMTKMAAVSDAQAVWKLALFIFASYCAIAFMFLVHALFLAAAGVNIWQYFKKVLPVLSFAFVGRSSAAAIPLNIEAQTKRLGVSEAIAGFSASFGATIGQNGCAGIYPAMLAAMAASAMGINPIDPAWLLTLIGIVTVSSFGVAGVGGGATFAALMVLPAMGLPITLVALLISVEPLIDMARTALNVNGSMTAGTVTARLLRQTDKKIFAENNKEVSHK